VDKNLFGVSGQVTAPGVLPFGHIFAALQAGKEPRPQAPRKEFAGTAVATGGNRL